MRPSASSSASSSVRILLLRWQIESRQDPRSAHHFTYTYACACKPIPRQSRQKGEQFQSVQRIQHPYERSRSLENFASRHPTAVYCEATHSSGSGHRDGVCGFDGRVEAGRVAVDAAVFFLIALFVGFGKVIVLLRSLISISLLKTISTESR